MQPFYSLLNQELQAGNPCVVVTVIATKGSTPRKNGAKMLIRSDGSLVGTIGGGKYESLVLDAAAECLESGELKVFSFPLHENADNSFGAICGGEITVLLEPHAMKQRLLISGAGHCGQSLAELALGCGWPVVVFDDRQELFETPFYTTGKISAQSDPDALTTFPFRPDDCLVLVSKGHPEDRAALKAVLDRDPIPELAYFGMIGSDRKVSMVFKDMEAEGYSCETLNKIYAPIGLDIGSESPAEIAISIMAEILQVTRKARGGHMKIK